MFPTVKFAKSRHRSAEKNEKIKNGEFIERFQRHKALYNLTNEKNAKRKWKKKIKTKEMLLVAVAQYIYATPNALSLCLCLSLSVCLSLVLVFSF